MTLSAAELTLVDRWQRGFPLVPRPYAAVGRSVGLAEADAVAAFRRAIRAGAVSRIGAVVRPRTVGASVLAAMQVAPDRLGAVAALVSAEPAVSHNYEREHAFNLWFVIAARDAATVDATLARIARSTGLPVLELPLERAYHIDLGFPLDGAARPRGGTPVAHGDHRPDERDRCLLGAIEDGLPLTTRPYLTVARSLQLDEKDVIDRLARLLDAGVIKRLGTVVRHSFFGYEANAMAVWDIPDRVVDAVAGQFAADSRVTLCYRRTRRPPEWPYNLFCMVHAKARAQALAVVADLNAAAATEALDQAVLFSTRCFKQRGAVFSARGKEP
jgi:DNA-binding Lrp family transcriptional regulator